MNMSMNQGGAAGDGAGQNKPGQRGSGRACLRNAFIKGVSAWRIGNQFALSNFVLIPLPKYPDSEIAARNFFW
jgi:hypothetical protein